MVGDDEVPVQAVRDEALRQQEHAERDRFEATLLLRLQAADRTALAELYQALAGAVHSLAVAVLHSREEAEEVVQDSFLKLYRQAAAFDPERGSVRAFLYAIARNDCLSRLRKRSVRPQASGHDPHDPLFSHDGRFGTLDADVVTRVTLEQALERLGEPERSLIEQVYLRGYSHRDLAERIDMPLGSLKTRVRRGLARLRELLEGA